MKSVQFGEIGETPRKEFVFSIHDPPIAIEQATPLRSSSDNYKSVLSRPKTVKEDAPLKENEFGTPQGRENRPTTSRGKARPSPDEFADYIIPPPLASEVKSPSVILFESDEEAEVPSDPLPSGDEIGETARNRTTLAIFLFSCALQA